MAGKRGRPEGHKLSDKTKRQIAISKTGQFKSKETKAKIRTSVITYYKRKKEEKMSYKSEHMNHILPPGLIRGNVELVKLKDIFALSDDEIRKLDHQHMGNTKFSDFQILFFFIKNDCIISAAARDLGTSPNNFTTRLSRLNVHNFSQVLNMYRKYRDAKGNILKVTKPKYKTKRHSLKYPVKAFERKAKHAKLTNHEVIVLNLATLEKEIFSSKEVREHINDPSVNRAAIPDSLKKLWEAGALLRLKRRGKQGAVYYKKTGEYILIELEKQDVIFSISTNWSLKWSAPAGVMTEFNQELVRQHKAEIMNVLNRR